MEPTPKQQIVEKLRSASNVLVTVSQNPTVDQLASAIGMTLMLNELNVRAVAVFSGEVPNALEFLDPEKNIDSSVDGLRDFIISIDKEKADKLRYKVEDNVVRIFITPYKQPIGEEDLVFSQGDFNVDVVLALGVTNRNDLDQAIVAHGRILHDATIASITSGENGQGDMGAINWHDPSASCISEMLVSMSEALKSGILDKAMSTAFLTGLISATDRFSNDKTTPKVMTMAAQLMSAGADQQLISKNLRMDRGRTKDLEEKTPPVNVDTTIDLSIDEEGKLELDDVVKQLEMPAPLPTPQPEVAPLPPSPQPLPPQVTIPDIKPFDTIQSSPAVPSQVMPPIASMPPLPIMPAVSTPPAPPEPALERHYVEPVAGSPTMPILGHQDESFSANVPAGASVAEHNISTSDTASGENASPDLEMTTPEAGVDINQARDEVAAALNAEPFMPANQPLASLGSSPMDEDEEQQIQIDEHGQMSYSEGQQAPAAVNVPPTLPPPLPPNPGVQSADNPLFNQQ